MSGSAGRLRLLFDVATFFTGLYFMFEIVVHGRAVQPYVFPVVAWMIGFPIANIIDGARAKVKERDQDA